MKKAINKIVDAILKPNTEISMTEDEFYEKYNPVKNHLDDNASFDGCMFETYGKEHDHILTLAQDPQKKNTVWTIIEAEENLYYVNDYHYVNRLGYLVTKEQFPEGLNIVVKLDNE
jgi:hypothetical protein